MFGSVMQDCNCGVNLYCGIDPNNTLVVPKLTLEDLKAPYSTKGVKDSTNPPTSPGGVPPPANRDIFLDALGFEGLPLRSTCLEYKVPSNTGPSFSKQNLDNYEGCFEPFCPCCSKVRNAC